MNSIYRFWDESKTHVSLKLVKDHLGNKCFIKKYFVLPFNGIVGVHNNPIFVNVPCMSMYNGEDGKPLKDPNLQYVLFMEPEKRAKYYPKNIGFFQGFIIDNDDAILRIFPFNRSIQKLLTASDANWDRIFHLRIKHIGQFRQFDGEWSIDEHPLIDAEQDTINTLGTFDLSHFIPKMPDEEHQAIIAEMFHRSLGYYQGQYDQDKWGKYYQPVGQAPVIDPPRIIPPTVQAQMDIMSITRGMVGGNG